MKKFIVLLMVGMLVLTGCGAKGDKDGDKIQLEFFSQKVEIKDLLEEIAADFMKDHDNVEITVTSLNDAATVLKTRMAGNDAPQILMVKAAYDDYRQWAKDGRFVDLTDSKARENMQEGAAENFAVEDKIYALPLTTNISGFFYNKTKFAELGLEVPQNWAEMEKLVEDIKAAGETPFAQTLNTADAWTVDGVAQLVFASVAGGYDEAQDILVNSPKDGIKADDPVVAEAMKQLRLMSAENSVANVNGIGYNDSIVAFAKGEGLLFPQGSWVLPGIKEQNPEFEIGMFAHPGKENGQYLTMGAPDLSLSISNEASEEQKAAALEFLEYFSSGEVMQKYYDNDGSPVFVKNVVTEGRHEEIKEVADLVTDPTKYVVWLTAGWPAGDEFMNATVDYMNSHDAEKFVKDLNAFFNKVK